MQIRITPSHVPHLVTHDTVVMGMSTQLTCVKRGAHIAIRSVFEADLVIEKGASGSISGEVRGSVHVFGCIDISGSVRTLFMHPGATVIMADSARIDAQHTVPALPPEPLQTCG